MSIGTNGANAFSTPPSPTTIWPMAIAIPRIAGPIAGFIAARNRVNPPPVMFFDSRSISPPSTPDTVFTTGERAVSNGDTSFSPFVKGASTGFDSLSAQIAYRSLALLIAVKNFSCAGVMSFSACLYFAMAAGVFDTKAACCAWLTFIIVPPSARPYAPSPITAPDAAAATAPIPTAS